MWYKSWRQFVKKNDAEDAPEDRLERLSEIFAQEYLGSELSKPDSSLNQDKASRVDCLNSESVSELTWSHLPFSSTTIEHEKTDTCSIVVKCIMSS